MLMAATSDDPRYSIAASDGGLFIDIVTQPGIGKIRGNGNLNYNGSQLNSHTAFVPEKPSEQNRSQSPMAGASRSPASCLRPPPDSFAPLWSTLRGLSTCVLI